MDYFSRMNTVSSYTQMAPLETNLLELSSLLEQNNFVNEVFKGLAFTQPITLRTLRQYEA